MENKKIEKIAKEEILNKSDYFCTSLMVFCYELLGTFCLVGAINASSANPAAIGLTFFFLLLLCSPISGGHMNPAVTLGVFINRVSAARENGTFGSLIFQAFNMVAG